MSKRKQRRIPAMRLHKPSGQAYVRLNGKFLYLGAYDSDGARARYDQAIREWLGNP